MIENNDNKNFWIYNNKIFSEQDAINYYGFVYLITNLINNKMYVGKKYFYIFRKCRKTGIKQLKYCDKWLTYFGSCELLKRDIIIYGKENFKREILYLYKSKEEVDECEINEQIKRNVLREKDGCGNRKYYNGNINSKYFCMNEISAEKISLKLKNKSKSETHRKVLSEVHKGHKPWNIGKKVPNSGNNKGRVRTEENKKKISETIKRLYRTGIVQHPRKNKLVSEETRKKMGELCIKLGILKEKIHIKEKIFITRYENKISFGALLVWSKRNRNNKRIHPKYNIKILKIHNKILNKTFFNYLENYLNLIKEGNDELKTK